jgi:hypothetical protein
MRKNPLEMEKKGKKEINSIKKSRRSMRKVSSCNLKGIKFKPSSVISKPFLSNICL